MTLSGVITGGLLTNTVPGYAEESPDAAFLEWLGLISDLEDSGINVDILFDSQQAEPGTEPATDDDNQSGGESK